jgi:uracil-DNA glycosylase family 4
MRYKLHPEVEARIPFDASRFAPGPPQVLYDEVEVEDITDRPRGDTTFFCIDVEETQNFVTAGGVVHNCRPPANRDPLPDEIAVCKPFLFRQIELIEPKVICTLGNFATKLLTEKPDGITRCHGRPCIRELGGRPVRLFPVFHPAAALRTPSIVELMRADFARLPAMLEGPLPEPVGEMPEVEDPPASTDAAVEPAPDSAPPRVQLDLF